MRHEVVQATRQRRGERERRAEHAKRADNLERLCACLRAKVERTQRQQVVRAHGQKARAQRGALQHDRIDRRTQQVHRELSKLVKLRGSSARLAPIAKTIKQDT